ncbi:MAG: hypothetical protein JNK85_27320 [Verrucomicrobiales bacterium]|nr:hypothetical protein [Verrucomicrobiales bacterium]
MDASAAIAWILAQASRSPKRLVDHVFSIVNRPELHLALGILASNTAVACRYNVRDVGFMDLDSETYRLEARVRKDTPPAWVSSLQTQASTALQGANVRLEIIHVDAPALDGTGNRAHPGEAVAPMAWTLVSPDGASYTGIAVPQTPASDSRWRSTLDTLLLSPTRAALREVVSRAFGAILLIDGTDTVANTRARAVIQEAIGQIRDHMRTLPKSIAQPPELVSLEVGSLARESVLLWSLSLETTPTSQPRAFILYGRLRWIGPVMNGEEISTRNLVGLFSMVGADCECGLDLQWTLGTRIPVRWDETTHAAAAKGLGFDPESPLVKAEILSILERRRSDPGPRARDGESGTPTHAPRPSHAPGTSEPSRSTTESLLTAVPAALPAAEVEIAIPMAWLILGGLATFVGAAAVVLFRRARRQQRLD